MSEDERKDVVVSDKDIKATVDSQTGEIIEDQIEETTPNDFHNQIMKLISTAGILELTDKQTEILYAPVEEDSVEIRPDGIIYLPWMEYVTRLRKAFGLSWTVVPQGMPKVDGNLLVWGFYLLIQGKFAGFAIGEQTYTLGSYSMSWGEACEGAKSNALMRLCKGLGISLELWKPSFIKAWLAKYAISEWIYNEKKGKKELKWHKRTQPSKIPVGKGVTVYKKDNSTPQGSKAHQKTSRKTSSDGVLSRTPADTSNGNNILNETDLPLKTFDILAAFKTQKERVGAEAYYNILKAAGYDHANKLPDRKTKILVYEELKKLPSQGQEEDNASESMPDDKIDAAFNQRIGKEARKLRDDI